MPYIETEKVAQMRKAIRKALPDYKVSVTKRHHSGVDVRLLSGPIPDVPNVNVFCYQRQLADRPDAVAVIDAILAEIKKVETPKIVSEDGDYGSIPNFYYDVSFGAWDKPYICTMTMPEGWSVEDEQMVRAEFDRIKNSEALVA